MHLREDGEPFGDSSWSTFMPTWLTKHCKAEPETGPKPCPQPYNDGWVMSYKLRRIKQLMMDKFGDARSLFSALDRDGGGSLDRKELATGLYQLGIWLSPKELQALLDTLDKDGGGDIDIGELELFWKAYNFD